MLKRSVVLVNRSVVHFYGEVLSFLFAFIWCFQIRDQAKGKIGVPPLQSLALFSVSEYYNDYLSDRVHELPLELLLQVIPFEFGESASSLKEETTDDSNSSNDE